ncbi:MAG: restriction endonuclease subunit S [Roseovarius sp.]|nr:restriction endonuclease subunit S [Roseovarius sp.]
MSDGWRQSTWGDEISLEYGKAIRGYQDAVAPFRVFGSNGPIGWSEKPLAQGPGVILGRKGAYRGVHFSPDPFFVIDTAYYVKPKSDLDMRWLYYAIIHHKLGEIDDGSPIPSTTRAAVYVRDVEVPPLHEQRAIAATLGALDDKIALNRKMNATLEAMARALFRDWFVDFGPTRAKAEGRAPYLSPDLWSLFPDRLDAEGKPEGWEVGTLNDVALLNPESWTTRNAPAQVRYVDLANTKWGSIDGVEHYSWPDAPSRARRILRAGDTIVGTVRPGNGSFCYVGEDGLTGSTGFAVLRPKNPRDQAFVWCAATSPENIERLAHLADGGAYPAVRPDAVAATETVIPGANVLEAFQEAVCANLDLMEANKTESRTLAQTRDLLLPRLMSGELRVAGAERAVEAAQ